MWQCLAFKGSVWYCVTVQSFRKEGLLCIVIFINGFMQKVFDKMEGNSNGIEPFFPVTFNPSRRADYCVHRNTASCVLRHSQPSLVPQNNLPFAGGRKNLRSRLFV